MQIVFVALKLLVVLAFLVRFIRRPSLVWGVGLLTVTTAALLDTLLGTFNREELLANLGFFFYVIAGVLLAGGAFWFWGVARAGSAGEQGSGGAGERGSRGAGEIAPGQSSTPANALQLEREPVSPAPLPPRPPAPLPPPHADGFATAGYDRLMLYEEVRARFSRDDLQDLMFDLDVNELDVVTAGQTNDELIVRIMDAADSNGRAGDVALAVERILTPPPPQLLPRLEKLTDDSPRTVLRHFLLANYSVEQLQALSADVNVDWEQLDPGSKKDKVRSLLLYLYRRNRIGDLLAAMKPRSE